MRTDKKGNYTKFVVHEGEWSDAEAYQQIATSGLHLIKRTKEVRQKANHYKQFRVGALAVVRSDAGRLAYVEAANRNDMPGDNPSKRCAEVSAIEAIDKNSDFAQGRLLALFVCGPQQADKHSTFLYPTLHPCGIERELLPDHPLARDNPVIITTRSRSPDIEVMTLDQLVKRHQPDYAGNPREYLTDADTWQRGAVLLQRQPEFLETVGVQYDSTTAKFQAAVNGNLEYRLSLAAALRAER